jgi:hypothetical protein
MNMLAAAADRVPTANFSPSLLSRIRPQQTNFDEAVEEVQAMALG